MSPERLPCTCWHLPKEHSLETEGYGPCFVLDCPCRRYETIVYVGECIRCGSLMGAIRGARTAVCTTCGYKDDCC